MQKLADETGGQAFVNTNDITGAIRRAVEDSAVTYTLGFYINLDSLDGKFHELKVQAKRSGLTLRYPKGYFAFQDTPAGQNQNSTSLAAEVTSPIESVHNSASGHRGSSRSACAAFSQDFVHH